MKTIIHATTYDFVVYHENQYVVFDHTIISTGPMSECPFEGEIIDVEHALVMPGLINAHSHIYSTFARGISVPFSPRNFKELLQQLWWKLDQHLTNEMTYYSGIVATVEHLKNGVTTIIDHHASGEINGSLTALEQAVCTVGKMRGVFCFETSDRYDIDSCIEENKAFIHEHSSSYTRGLFGLHASFTLSDETLKRVHQQSASPIHIHVAESSYDQDDALKRYDKTPMERLYKHGLLTPHSLLAHCIHVTEEDLQIIKESEATVVVNVTSNMNNGVSLPHVLSFLDNDIPTIIGNDGISYSIAQEYISLYFAMHHHYQSATMFTMDHLQQMIVATYQYASSLLGVKLGRISPGYEADMVVLPYDAPTPAHSDNMMGHMVFGVFRTFHPQHVYIAGEPVLDNYHVSDTLMTEYNNAKDAAHKCWQSVAKGEE